MIKFFLSSPTSFTRVLETWVPEIIVCLLGITKNPRGIKEGLEMALKEIACATQVLLCRKSPQSR